jgi:hypothetical protein
MSVIRAIDYLSKDNPLHIDMLEASLALNRKLGFEVSVEPVWWLM